MGYEVDGPAAHVCVEGVSIVTLAMQASGFASSS